jgi:hypothetical protein
LENLYHVESLWVSGFDSMPIALPEDSSDIRPEVVVVPKSRARRAARPKVAAVVASGLEVADVPAPVTTG